MLPGLVAGLGSKTLLTMNFDAPMNTLERQLMRQAIDAAEAMTCELKAMREQHKQELVTKCDLKETECRILRAIEAIGAGKDIDPESQRLLNQLNQRAETGAKKLEALAALTPNK